jgi:signal transduction histidine kinase
MYAAVPPRPSLIRTFAILSLVIIALITAVQVAVQWFLLREDLLAWERTATARQLRTDATAVLRPQDFRDWQTAEAQARFAELYRRALANPEILRVKIYGPDMRVLWSDEPRLLGRQFTDNAALRRALGGRVIARLEHARTAENVFEVGLGRTIELYVPLTLPGGVTPGGVTPGTAIVAGVVEIYKDPAVMFGNLQRDRLVVVATSLAGAAILYLTLFWIVRRASRQLERQRADLERHAEAMLGTNNELRAAQQQLRAAERLAAIGEVSTTVAHGIRNPLANIRASAQVALSAASRQEPADRYLRAIVDEVDRLGAWLRALLDAVRPFEPHVVPVDVNTLVADTLGLLAARAAEAGVGLESQLAPELPKVAADAVHVQQALLGILENAVEAAPPGGHVAVRTEIGTAAGPGEIVVTVADDGAGIPSERLGQVFEPFFTTKVRGTGLGLAIARKVMQAHGGRIEIESRPGTGTTVRCTLPAEPAARGRSR